MTPSMPVHGACHCGAVAFQALVDPGHVSICHCTDCQQLTGSAYRVTVAAGADGFALLRGVPRTYIKRADSGNPRAQVFCADCGSPLYAHAAVDQPQRYTLRVGCLQERQALVPRQRIWCQSALAWSVNLDGMATVERQ